MELIGLLLPVAIDLFNRKLASSDARFWVSVFVCSLVGAGLNYLDTSFQYETAKAGFESLAASIMTVFGYAQLSYKAVWEQSSMRDTITNK